MAILDLIADIREFNEDLSSHEAKSCDLLIDIIDGIITDLERGPRLKQLGVDEKNKEQFIKNARQRLLTHVKWIMHAQNKEQLELQQQAFNDTLQTLLHGINTKKVVDDLVDLQAQRCLMHLRALLLLTSYNINPGETYDAINIKIGKLLDYFENKRNQLSLPQIEMYTKLLRYKARIENIKIAKTEALWCESRNIILHDIVNEPLFVYPEELHRQDYIAQAQIQMKKIGEMRSTYLDSDLNTNHLSKDFAWMAFGMLFFVVSVTLLGPALIIPAIAIGSAGIGYGVIDASKNAFSWLGHLAFPQIGERDENKIDKHAKNLSGLKLKEFAALMQDKKWRAQVKQRKTRIGIALGLTAVIAGLALAMAATSVFFPAAAVAVSVVGLVLGVAAMVIAGFKHSRDKKILQKQKQQLQELPEIKINPELESKPELQNDLQPESTEDLKQTATVPSEAIILKELYGVDDQHELSDVEIAKLRKHLASGEREISQGMTIASKPKPSDFEKLTAVLPKLTPADIQKKRDEEDDSEGENEGPGDADVTAPKK